MPRIDAPTVAEHRARQRAALVETAEQLLLTGGWDALTFAALGEAAGLARSSVYEYFGTRSEIALAACGRAFDRWQEAIEEAMASARTPRTRVAAYVREQLRLVSAGEHRIGQAIARAPLDADARAAIGARHQGWLHLLDEPLAALGAADPALTAAFVQGVVEAATRRLEAAPERRAAIEREALRFVARALEA